MSEAVEATAPAEQSAAQSETSSRMETLVAVLIAVTTLVGAFFAWRSSVAADAAGDADYAGLRAAVAVEETRAVNAVNAYQHYAAFTSFDRQDELARLIEEQGGPQREVDEARELASSSRSQFPAKFVNRDGTYALHREMGEMWADASREKDLNPEPQFQEADGLRSKSLGLLGAVTFIAIALVFFTLVEALGAALQVANGVLGSLCLVGGTVLGTYFELFFR
jgi:hypothetical protein